MNLHHYCLEVNVLAAMKMKTKLLTKIARSNNKVARAMKKLSRTAYNAMPGRLLQAGTYMPTRSSSLAEIEMFKNSQI